MRRISDLMNLEGRTAIVTGGAGHIGLAICEALMELGATVSVFDLSDEACRERCLELNAHGFKGQALPFAADLSSEEETRRAVKAAIRKMKCLHILVHSAAFVGTTSFPGWAVPLNSQTVKAWDAALRINLTSAFTIVQTAQSALAQSGYGSVIFISSIYGRVGPDNRIYEGTTMVTPAGYAASKGGLNQLGRYFATLLAPGIRVNTITSGGVRRGQKPVFQKRYAQRTPLGRMAIEEDFKGAVAYLSTDASSYVTGTELIVDGGWTAW